MSSPEEQNNIAASAYSIDSLETPPTPDDSPTLMVHSHPGEHHKDFSGDPSHVKITRSTYKYVLCAALNSCNLGYDIGVNTQAGPLLQDAMNLTDSQLEILLGSLNLFSMIGAAGANFVTDRYGRRKSFIVSEKWNEGRI